MILAIHAQIGLMPALFQAGTTLTLGLPIPNCQNYASYKGSA